MFLVGPPGPLQRHIAMSFCELTGREMEYVSLSRDTTETDLKQRREIIRGTVHYIDQVRQETKCYSLEQRQSNRTMHVVNGAQVLHLRV